MHGTSFTPESTAPFNRRNATFKDPSIPSQYSIPARTATASAHYKSDATTIHTPDPSSNEAKQHDVASLLPPPPPAPLPPLSNNSQASMPAAVTVSLSPRTASSRLRLTRPTTAMQTRQHALRIRTAITDTPFTEIVVSDQEKTIRDIKLKLKNTHNIPRFRVRLLNEDNCLKDEETILHHSELKIVILNYIEASTTAVNELMNTVRSGTTAQLESILERPLHPDSTLERHEQYCNCNSNCCNPFGALETAVLEGHLPKVRLLLEAQADLQKPGNDTALLAAVDCGFREITDLLLKAKANPNISSEDGCAFTSLWLATCKGEWQMMHSLLKARAQVNTTDFSGTTPLHLACEQSEVSPVLDLLTHEADPETRNVDGETPITTAFWWNQFDVLQAMRHHLGWETKPSIRNSDTEPWPVKQ